MFIARKPISPKSQLIVKNDGPQSPNACHLIGTKKENNMHQVIHGIPGRILNPTQALAIRSVRIVVSTIRTISLSLLVLQQCLPFLENCRGLFLDLRQLDASSRPAKLRQVQIIRPFVLHHLQKQFHLIDVVNKLGFQCLILLVLAEHL